MKYGQVGIVLAALALIVCAGPGLADEHEPVKKYKATFHKDGKQSEKTFDRSNPEHAKEITHLIEEGHLAHLSPDEEVNLLAISWDLGLWTVIVFLLLYLILKKAAWGPMLEGLQKREESIRNAVEEAKRAREETERVRAELQAEVARAHEQIPKLLDEARKDAQRLAEEMRAKAQADIQADRQRLRREIDLALEQALQEIYKQAAQLATLISAKAIGRSLTEEDHRRLVEEALAELHRTGKRERNGRPP